MAFIEIVVILVGFALSLQLLGLVMNFFSGIGQKDLATILAEYRREQSKGLREELMLTGPQTRIVSFEVRTNPR